MCDGCKCRTCSYLDWCSNYKTNPDENYCKFCKGTKKIDICIRYEERECIDLGKWKRVPSPKERGYGNGWCGELDEAFVEGNKYVVMTRLVETSWGIVKHLCIRNAANTDIKWSEKQRIKNEVVGPERIAIEVFPKISQLVDEANMYHLWVLPEGIELPFRLHI